MNAGVSCCSATALDVSDGLASGARCLVPRACPVPAASHTRIMHYYAELVSVLLFLLSFALRRCLAWLGLAWQLNQQ